LSLVNAAANLLALKPAAKRSTMRRTIGAVTGATSRRPGVPVFLSPGM
jgi:hypothetical protein